MRYRIVAIVVLAISLTRSAHAGPDLDRVAALIIEQTNAFRAEEKLDAVKSEEHLTAAAKYFAGYMAKNEKYGHEADGKEPYQRAEDHKYHYCIVLENIAWMQSSEDFETEQLATKLVEGWKDSPGHRKNMLDPDITDTGVAVSRGESGKYYAVQMFGRPKSAMVTFQLTNHSKQKVTYTLDDQSYDLPPNTSRTHGVCRVPVLKVDLGNDQPTTIKPERGAEYVVTQNKKGELAIGTKE